MLIIWLLCVFGLIAQSNSIKNVTKDREYADESATANSETKLDLDKAETKDSKIEIIKQIRRVNDDGSYTVGYEADDGTFKIESRDVLGNVKGTYGYVDSNGEIKRVSYTANNATNDLKTTPAPSAVVEDVVHIPRQNRTAFVASTTRRPASLAYLTSSAATPTRSNVIQPIPKRRILISSTERSTYSTSNQFSSHPRHSDRTTTLPRKTEPTTTIVYATSLPQKQTVSIRPTSLPGATFKTVEQISRPEKLEITDRVSKVHVNQILSSTEKPVIEETDEKERERKPQRGNFLRRQLPEENLENLENFEAQEQVVYSQSAGEDSNPIYGGVAGNVRQLYSTTSSPRIPALVLAARTRASNLQKSTANSLPQTTSTTERVYSKPPRRKIDRHEEEGPTTESTSDNNYLTQSPIPVQIPANRDLSQAGEEQEQRVYRQPATYSPRSREYARQAAAQDGQREYGGPRQYRIPIPRTYAPATFSAAQTEGEQYLRETTDPSIRDKASTNAEQEQYAAAEPTAPQQPTPFALPQNRHYLPYQQQPVPNAYEQQQQSYPAPYPQFGGPYYRPPVNPQYYNSLDRPLTARDFERLLNLLVFRQQQYQRYNYLPNVPPINPYGYPGAGAGYNPYPPAYGGYPHVPRPPLYNPYDPRNSAYNRLPISTPPYGTAIYNEDENMYQAQNPIPEQQAPYAGQRLIPRKRQYNPHYFGAQAAAYPQPAYMDEAQNQIQAPPLPAPQPDYLPPEVREELLYRMLMLAIQSEQAAMHEASAPQEYVKSSGTTTTQSSSTTTPAKFKKPVRSVQILGEE